MAAAERRGPGPRGAAVREAVMLLLLCLGIPGGRPYNVDTESALLYRGVPGTLFGYSVVLHGHGADRWLVVGAPTASWLANASVVNPGAVYRCRIGRNPRRTCEQLQLAPLENPAERHVWKKETTSGWASRFPDSQWKMDPS